MSGQYIEEENAVGAGEFAVTIPDDDSFAIVLDQATLPERWNRESFLDVSVHATEDEYRRDVISETTTIPGKLQQFVGKCQIQFTMHNPMPSLCRAIEESHFPLEHDMLSDSAIAMKERSPRALWKHALRVQNDDLLATDVEAVRDGGGDCDIHMSTSKRSRDDLVVKNLPMAIQLAFRQSVLCAVMLTKCGIALLVCVCIAVLPFTEWRRSNEAGSTWLLHVMLTAASVSLYLLGLGLLYVVRFDFPINSAVVVFLLSMELCCWLAVCLLGNLNAIATICLLFTITVVGIYALATYRWKPQATSADDFELLHPMIASLVSLVLVLAVTSVVYSSKAVPALSPATIPLATFACCLTGVALMGLWTGLTLHCMSASLTPDEHTRCLVFFHSDIIVACCVVPLRWLQRCVSVVVRLMKRRNSTSGRATPAALSAAVCATDHTSSSLELNPPVEDARGFKNHRGEVRAAATATAVASGASVGSSTGGGASRRRSSIAETV